jgi:hypothetical protein
MRQTPVRGVAVKSSTSGEVSVIITWPPDLVLAIAPLPAHVDLLDVELVFHVHVLQQVEEKQRHVGVRLGRQVRHGAGPAEAGVNLAEIELIGVQVMQNVHLEVAAVTLAAQDAA